MDHPDPSTSPDRLARLVPSAAVGDRLVLRAALPDGSATDTIGWVTELSADAVTVVPLASEPVRIPRGALIAARRAPAAPGGPGPARTTAEELEQIALPGWVAGREPLGEWTLRAGGGFTGRANSCLAVGSPGVAPADAADRIVAHATAHQIRPLAQVVLDSDPERALLALGWAPTYVETDVFAVRLGDLLGSSRPDPSVLVTDSLTTRWRSTYDVSRPNNADPSVLATILTGSGPVAFASVSDGGDVVAIGRAHANDGWVGFASIWTRPDHRGQGHATRILLALGHWAARRGARNAYLQVETANDTAHRAYAKQGFTLHHRYRYLTPAPGSGPALGP